MSRRAPGMGFCDAMTDRTRNDRSPPGGSGEGGGEGASRAPSVTRDGHGDAVGTYASPPCLLHEIDPRYAGLSFPPVPGEGASVRRWRAEAREALRAAHRALAPVERAARSARIGEMLTVLVRERGFASVAGYWPMRGEPDLRGWMKERAAEGLRLALPVVVERGAPLVFRRWAPGERLVPGVWDIPAPAAGAEVVPEAVIAPLVGFDRARYRLGNGGGYFDRTLAALTPRPYAIGVGYAEAELATIFPQPHDVPMDAIVTDRGLVS